MSRRESIFDIVPNAKQMIKEKIEKEGSQLGRVLARCAWNVEYDVHIFCNLITALLFLDQFHQTIHISDQSLQLILHLI
jgi:hypothetical protein